MSFAFKNSVFLSKLLFGYEINSEILLLPDVVIGDMAIDVYME